MKPRYKISYYMRIVLTVVIYLVFFGYIIYSLINAKNKESVLFNLIMGIGVGGVGLLYEYLRINYDAATKRLIVDNRPDQTLKLLENVEKFDLFKAFKSSCKMMRMLALTDLREFDQIKDYVKKLDEEDSYDYDTEIVARYSQMIAYGETSAKGKSNEAFKQLISLRDKRTLKGKRYKGAFYFNWEIVNGQHKNYDGDYDSAYRYLKDIDESALNRREIMHYLLAKTVAARNCNQKQVYEDSKQRLLKVAENNDVMIKYIENL